MLRRFSGFKVLSIKADNVTLLSMHAQYAETFIVYVESVILRLFWHNEDAPVLLYNANFHRRYATQN